MTVKEYLNQGYRLKELIKSDQDELELLKTLSTSISSTNLSGTPGGSSYKTDAVFVESLMKIDALEQKIKSEINTYLDIKEKIRSLIFSLDDPNMKLILKFRYIDREKWEDIASKMNFTIQWVHKLHQRALSELKPRIVD